MTKSRSFLAVLLFLAVGSAGAFVFFVVKNARLSNRTQTELILQLLVTGHELHIAQTGQSPDYTSIKSLKSAYSQINLHPSTVLDKLTQLNAVSGSGQKFWTDGGDKLK